MVELLDAGEPDATIRAAEVLSAGGLVVLPTDTVYGLAASAADPRGTESLFARKGRRADVPVAVLCASVEQALDLAAEVPEGAARLALEHWPGALTLVLRRRADLRWVLGEPQETIGVRCPDHDFVRGVAAAVGPLATTSANRHGEPTPPSAAEAADSLVGPVDLVVDGGPLTGSPSAVVDATGDRLRLLRPGGVEVELD
jgi:L-threonylcarbamoyladenylate synthase